MIEPIFTLGASDPAAAELARDYAEIVEVDVEKGVRPAEDTTKVEEARALADQMDVWRSINVSEEG